MPKKKKKYQIPDYEMRRKKADKSPWKITNRAMFKRTPFESLDNFKNACDQGGGW